MALKHEYILNPVTALEFYQLEGGSLLILAGEGSFLKVFDARTWKLLCLCEIFEGQAIHGIVAQRDANHDDILQIAIWGGSCLVLLNRDDFEQLLAQGVSSLTSSATTLSDWILDVAISTHDDSCVLVTAHNTVLQARSVESGGTISTELSSPSRSILYSADIIWESPSQILVAAGTVFGEIIVWECSTSGRSQVLFTFSGHDGSIFGVDMSPPIVHSNGTVSRMLASCSDDRTIRIWDLTTASSSNWANSAAGIRETGFGVNGSSDDAQVGNRCIATVMGHASRIWRVKLLVEPHASAFSPIHVLSFGEDSTTQQWSLDLEASARVQTGGVNYTPGTKVDKLNITTPGAVKLSQLSTFAYHSGKSIWSTAILHTKQSAALLATGGADGKISVYDLATISRGSDEKRLPLIPTGTQYLELPIDSIVAQPASSWSSSWTLEDVLERYATSLLVGGHASDKSQPQSKLAEDGSAEARVTSDELVGVKKSKKPKRISKDAFSRYAFVSESQFIATTNSGRVLLCDLDFGGIWSEVVLPKSTLHDLQSYTVVEGFAEINTAFLADSSGKIYAYQHDSTLQVVGNVDGKVADMFKIFDSRTNTFELLVTTLLSRSATLFAVNRPHNDTVQLSVVVRCNLPDRFVVTSAGRSNRLMVIGARSGQLAFYDVDKSTEPLTMWKPAVNYASDAITTILSLPTSISDEEHANYFLTTERTGCYSIFSFTVDMDPGGVVVGATARCVHHGTLPFGPMVEAAWFQGGDLFFYGFKSKNFTVWNETKQCEISNVDCGGAHRSYAYSPVGSKGGGHFVYTKASKLYYHFHRKPSHIIAKQGGHGREIKACAVSTVSGMVATGAEDTAIRIWRYESKTLGLNARFDCIAVIQGHTAGIQHLRWHQSGYLFSSGGNEEFFVWAVQIIPRFGIGVIREATCPDKSAGQDLRIMSFDVTELPHSWNTKSSSSLLISLAFSDSTIRTYAYSRSGGFELLVQGKYTSSCLTQIRHLQVLDDHVCLLTAATDGNLTLWRGNISKGCDIGARTARHVIISNRKIHQSTIKSLDIMIKSDNLVVVTGGDDNALGVSIYPMSCLRETTLNPRVFLLGSAHSSAVTGVCIVPVDSDTSGVQAFTVLSSGNDQRVKEWRVQLGGREDFDIGREHGLGLFKVADVFTSVADVGDLSILKDEGDSKNKALVVGNGVELWGI